MRGHQQYTWQHTSGYGRSQDAGPSAFFGLIRSWAAGVVVLLVAQYLLYTAVSQPLNSMERAQSFGWRLILFHLPTLVCALLATLAAARVHPEPHRDRAGRHLLACLAAPIASRAVVMAMNWSLLTVEGIVAPTMAVIAGCVIGVVLDMVLEARE